MLTRIVFRNVNIYANRNLSLSITIAAQMYRRNYSLSNMHNASRI